MGTVREAKVVPENARSYLLGMNAGSLDAAMAGFADDATYFGIEKRGSEYYRRLYSKAEFRLYIGAWLEKASKGVTYEIRREVQYGDALLIEWADVAKGEAAEYHNEGMLIFEFNEEGLVRHARAYQDFGPLYKWDFLGR